MNNEVRDMIGKVLRDEPPVGVSFDAVLAAGRRRRARRQVGIVGGAVLGVAAVVSSGVLIGHLSASPALIPAGPTTSAPRPAPGCTIPAYTGGFSDAPAGTASAEELAESARLTEAFGRFAFPLPPGVTMDPAKPPLCVIKGSWGAQFTLHSPAGDRAIFLEVRPRAAQPPGDCAVLRGNVRCGGTTLPDGTSVLITEQALGSANPVIVNATAWRSDDTLVRVMETGSEAPKPVPRLLDDDSLIKIASAPQLKVAWSGPARPPEASEQRAAELTNYLAKIRVLPDGMVAPGLTFRVSQGGYKLNTDLGDAAGIGNLFINLNAPEPDATVDCRGQAGCEPITLPDGRKATVTRSSDGPIQRIMLNTMATDGTQVFVMTSNQSERMAASQGTPQITRPTPSLSVEDLIRVASAPWLRW